MKIFKGAYAMSFALIFTFVCIWLACSKNQKSETCVTCKSKQPEIMKLVSIGNQSFLLGIYNETRFNNLVLAKVQKENDQTSAAMQNIVVALDKKGFYNQLVNDGYKPVGYDLYMKTNLKSGSAYALADIAAISIFMYKDKGIHHYLYTMDESGKSFAINSTYSAVTDDINLKDKYLLFDRVVGNGSDIISLVTTVTPAIMDVSDKVETGNRLQQTILQSTANLRRAIPIDSYGDKCDPKVCAPIQDSKAKCVELIGGWACKEQEDPDCPTIVIMGALAREAELEILDDAFYTFRNAVLAQSPNGRAIISKYELAGDYFFSHVRDIDLMMAYNFITLLHGKVTKILSDVESTDILYDAATRDQALAYIVELRGMDASREWQDTLDWLEALVIQFADRPVSEIFTYLNS